MVHGFFCSLILVLYLCAVSFCAPSSDKIDKLPGFESALPSDQYSGYLKIGEASNIRKIHYYLVVSESNPRDPVVVWLQGGPGCSSLGGFFSEMGPFYCTGFDDKCTNLAQREWRWNRNTTMLYVEAPVGVGFSYSVSQPLKPFVTDDDKTAEDSYIALQYFFTLFPEFQNNDFYLSGESYAGIYVPMLAKQIHIHNLENTDPIINLKGILVGNGAVATGDWYEGSLTEMRMEYFFHHALFSPVLHKKILSVCLNFTAPRTHSCNQQLQRMHKEIGNLNEYYIDMTCGDQPTPSPMTSKHIIGGNVLDYDPCDDTGGATTYLNREDVRKALHVATADVIGKWTPCADGSRLHYTRIPQDERIDVYPWLLGNYSILIYNGDRDSCIPYTHDAWWTSSLGLAVQEDWRPWIVDGAVMGYVTHYDKNFTVATVKGAGHMVPEFTPKAAWYMLERFINGSF